MIANNIKLSVRAIRAARWRSLMTMFGIIIGVASVITTVSLGEGVKSQVAKQINFLGHDIITIRPGSVVDRDPAGSIVGVNVASTLGTNTLTEEDVRVVQQTPGVGKAVPLSIVSGVPTYNDREFKQGVTIATTSELPDILKYKVEFGEFFRPNDEGRNVAVIGSKLAQELFRENVPTGKIFTFRNQDFIVRGVLENVESNPLIPGVDFNATVFIPSVTGKTLTSNASQTFQIFVKPSDPETTDATIMSLRGSMREAHGGEEDFTILTQAETLETGGNILGLLTSLVAGIAAVSLFVGGVGIMNIMLVSVTERIHEIGIRKAIGATNRQILNEFLIEAMVLSFVGGLIGSVIAMLLNILTRIFTNVQPVINWRILLIANVVSLGVGVVFGVAPAVKAARKDPIKALRNE